MTAGTPARWGGADPDATTTVTVSSGKAVKEKESVTSRGFPHQTVQLSVLSHGIPISDLFPSNIHSPKWNHLQSPAPEPEGRDQTRGCGREKGSDASAPSFMDQPDPSAMKRSDRVQDHNEPVLSLFIKRGNLLASAGKL